MAATPAAPAPQPLAGGVEAAQRGEGGAGGRASRGRAGRAPGGGGPGPRAAGLGPERGRTPTRRDAQGGRGECCPGGNRGGGSGGRARPPLPLLKFAAGQTPSLGTRGYPTPREDRNRCRRVEGVSHLRRRAPGSFPGRRWRGGRSGWRATPSPGALQRPPQRSPRCPGTPRSLQRALIPGPLSRVTFWSPRQGWPGRVRPLPSAVIGWPHPRRDQVQQV